MTPGDLRSLVYRLEGEREAAKFDRRERPLAGDPRPPGRHDRDRLLYSRSLLRLSGVTQVLSPSDEGSLTHNRLTHSIKVAQVARALAEHLLLERHDEHDVIVQLGGLDVDVVEAAAYCHDTGHPPFGHIGEEVLDRYARVSLDLADGYEGNAQAFRIAATLEPRSADWSGMDLLPATLAAVLKYPWARSEAEDTSSPPPKFGYFTTESGAFTRARSWLPPGYADDAQSLEAAVMDVADDITYALHDLEDFRSAGLMSPIVAAEELFRWVRTHGDSIRAGEERSDEKERVGRLRARLRGNPRYQAGLFVDAVQSVAGHLTTLSQADNPRWRVSLQTSRRLVSKLITDFIAGVQLNATPSRQEPPLQLSADHWHQVQVLKQLTRDFVIARSDVAAVQRGQQFLLEDLLQLVKGWVEHPTDASRVPPQLRELHASFSARGMVDFVASLTDRGAIALRRTLRGEGLQTVIPGVSF